MASNLFNFFFGNSKIETDKRFTSLIDFSLAAPQALDPEQLADAVGLLEQFKWDAEKAAQHINNNQLKDFDDAMQDKREDPLEYDEPPGPSC